MGSTVYSMKKLFELSCNLCSTILEWVAILETEMAIHSSILAWKIQWTRAAWQATVHGVVRVGHDLATKLPHTVVRCNY